MICEYCEKEYTIQFATGRFCSRQCACGFSTKEKRKEINRRVSKKLEGVCYFTPEILIKRNITRKANRTKWLLSSNFNDLRKWHKKERVILEQKGKCEICGISDWMGKKLSFEFHHKDGNKNNDSRENVSAICPNCHSQTINFRKMKPASRVGMGHNFRKNSL